MSRQKRKVISMLLVVILTMLNFSSLVYANNGKGNGNNNDNKSELYELKVTTGNNGEISIDTDYYEEGEEINFTITPDSGYETNNVNITKGELIENSKNNFTYIMPSKKVVLSVSFKKSKEEVIDYEKDTDGDGIPDYFETEYFNTDPNNPDTDSDGLTDYEEIYLTGTDPLKQDTDDNGVLDPDEDIDGDGLTNIEEIRLDTFPFESDSDFDGLTDYEEVKIYETNPLEYDTDFDGLSDSKEIEIGLDPNNPDTNGNGILDGDETFKIEEDYEEKFESSTVVPSLDIELKGYQLKSLNVYQASEENIYTSKEIPGFIGNAYDFRVEDDIESGILTFNFSPKLRFDNNDELAIYEVDKVNQEMVLLPNQTVDMENYAVSAPINELSQKTYMLLNKTEFDEEFMLELAISEIGSDLDIVFAIDSSGSMGWNDPTDIRKRVTKDFIDILGENDRVGIVDFDSYAYILSSLTTDKESAKNAVNRIDSNGGTNLSRAMDTSIRLHLNSQIKNIEVEDNIFLELENLLLANNETVENTTEKGLNGLDLLGNEITSSSAIEVKTKEIENNEERLKYIILLTDGEGTYSTSYTSLAKSNNIKVYTVGLGSSVDVSLLQSIASGTDGKYFHANNAEGLIKEFETMKEEIVDLTIDTDGDGLSDYHEKYLRLFNGVYLSTDPENSDTDGDGISDYDELEIVYGYSNRNSSYEQVIEYYKMNSDPTKIDTDGDGLYDDIDPNPKAYDATGKTLANVAELSYTNLENYVGKTIEEVESLRNKPYFDTLKMAEIIHANDSEGGMFNDFEDKGSGNIALRIPKIGQNDIIIYGLRGTEIGTDDIITDIGLALGAPSSVQSEISYLQYKNLNKNNSDVYVTGHSLGGRLVLDVLYKTYDRNETQKPMYATTFNGLGYFGGSLPFIDWDTSHDSGRNLTNYYVKGDLVGDIAGSGLFYARPGIEREFVQKNQNIFKAHTIDNFIVDDEFTLEFTYESSMGFDSE